jgi:hypothetical protein
MPRVDGRVRVVATWMCAGLVPVVCALALVGSRTAEPYFSLVGLSIVPAALVLLSVASCTYAGVGALVASRLPSNSVGWLLLGIGGCSALSLAAIEYTTLGWPGAVWANWSTQFAALPLVLTVYLVLMFPDGHLVSRRWRPALWLTHFALVVMVWPLTPFADDQKFPNPIGIQALNTPVLTQGYLAFGALAAAAVVAAAAFIYRYRWSRGYSRAQLKWFAWVAGIAAGTLVAQDALWFRAPGSPVAAASLALFLASLALLPVACGVAILRYHLYDIDRIVSRAVAYLLLTGIVVGVYVGVVTAASALLPDSASQAVVASATLAAAAAFEPARRHVQRVVDHRFNRERYDAQRLIERYAEGLRHTVDLEGAHGQLVAVVHGAVEPTTVALWVRPQGQPPS